MTDSALTTISESGLLLWGDSMCLDEAKVRRAGATEPLVQAFEGWDTWGAPRKHGLAATVARRTMQEIIPLVSRSVEMGLPDLCGGVDSLSGAEEVAREVSGKAVTLFAQGKMPGPWCVSVEEAVRQAASAMYLAEAILWVGTEVAAPSLRASAMAAVSVAESGRLARVGEPWKILWEACRVWIEEANRWRKVDEAAREETGPWPGYKPTPARCSTP